MKRKIDITSRYMVLLVLILFIVNAVLGALLTYQSASAMRSQISQRMLDISNSAASLLDGDVLREITPEGKGTPGYEAIIRTLRTFQQSIELEYIYCIRDEGNRKFTFGIDPTYVDPAEFGSPVVYTDALYSASKGMPAVESTPYYDRWGEFYSAYSPVFDSMGCVAGIVAVDFSKAWYDKKLAPMIWTTVISAISSLILSVVVVMTLTSKNHRRIAMINGQLNELADSFDKLMHEVQNMSGITAGTEDAHPAKVRYEGDDDIESIRMKILEMHDELYFQIASVKEQAFIDGMTGVRNKASYLNTEKNINQMIKEEKAAFSVIVFDINGLKSINDDFGHEFGDMAITDATNVLSSVYDKSNIFRIGGDEFIVILNTISEQEVQNSISRLDYRLAAENIHEKPYKRPLTISMGYAVYTPGTDKEYKEVFHRADMNMYADKAAYYTKHNDRRRR